MTNDEQKNNFLRFIGEHWEQQQEKLRKYCSNKRLQWDDDIFCETILKVSEKILRKGIDDPTDSGFENYFFKAFKINVLREQQYSRNARRDKNIENLNELWEEYANANFSTSQDKLLSDLKKDFSAIFILSKVESEFGSELARLFTEKYYIGLTYKELQKRFPERRKLRDCLLEMKRWAIENINREDVDKAFNETYSDIIGD